MTPLEGSIKKWEDIVVGTGEDEGTDNCPLCEEYAYELDKTEEGYCQGCPVSEKTGVTFCGQSPYAVWDDHLKNDHKQIIPFSKVKGCPTCTTLAQAELDFLKSLRPKGE